MLGEDLIMAKAARLNFPYSIECKNVEKLNVWGSIQTSKKKIQKIMNQSWSMKKNNHKPLIVVDAEHFVKIYEDWTHDVQNKE